MFKHYDPTNLDGDYLEAKELRQALNDMYELYGTEDQLVNDTMGMIEYFEKKRSEITKSGGELSELDTGFQVRNKEFRSKYGDWVHHDNKYYDEFYNRIDEMRGTL